MTLVKFIGQSKWICTKLYSLSIKSDSYVISPRILFKMTYMEFPEYWTNCIMQFACPKTVHFHFKAIYFERLPSLLVLHFHSKTVYFGLDLQNVLDLYFTVEDRCENGWRKLRINDKSDNWTDCPNDRFVKGFLENINIIQ